MSARFLCDENISGALVRALAARGRDVLWIAATAPGMSDPAVLALAREQGRVLITADKDFGELATANLRGTAGGVILLRVALPPTEDAAGSLAELITGRDDWPGHLAVVEPGRLRMRRLEHTRG
ncbi:DUF5615 family PIN-like protein [Elioraea sp.]|uniref:DUF5615 family PIN-like protein n=1 Tax=Elioraea sp. TaxID=2185103 RepID=UPI003F70FE4C